MSAIGLNRKGVEQFIRWVIASFKGSPLSDSGKRAWVLHFTDFIGKDNSARSYSMHECDTKDGLEKVFYFDDSMLDFAEIDDEF